MYIFLHYKNGLVEGSRSYKFNFKLDYSDVSVESEIFWVVIHIWPGKFPLDLSLSTGFSTLVGVYFRSGIYCCWDGYVVKWVWPRLGQVIWQNVLISKAAIRSRILLFVMAYCNNCSIIWFNNWYISTTWRGGLMFLLILYNI